METLTLTNAHSTKQNNRSLKLARRIKMLGLFQAPLLIASFTAVGLRGVVPTLFGYIWSAWIWHLFVIVSGLSFHGLGYFFWFAKLRGWNVPFERSTGSGSSTRMETAKGSRSTGDRSHSSNTPSTIAENGSISVA
jgi:hypothetical protein